MTREELLNKAINWFKIIAEDMSRITSGKEGQFSDSDKKCAENYDIDYIDVNDFINYE